jgi:hypothetical protein
MLLTNGNRQHIIMITTVEVKTKANFFVRDYITVLNISPYFFEVLGGFKNGF